MLTTVCSLVTFISAEQKFAGSPNVNRSFVLLVVIITISLSAKGLVSETNSQLNVSMSYVVSKTVCQQIDQSAKHVGELTSQLNVQSANGRSNYQIGPNQCKQDQIRDTHY